jgi:hypothetical protein
MALDDAQITTLARALGERIFVRSNTLAHSNLDNLKAAVQRVDQIMDATTNQAATLRPATTIKALFREEIKAVAGNLSNQDAAIALVIWVADAAGIIDVLGVK